MKIRNYLEHIAGVGIYPVITLLMFFLFFALLTFWVIRTGRHPYQTISRLPLDGGEADPEFAHSNR